MALHRQSRLLRFDDHGYELFTVDHVAGGRLRLDMQHQWASQEQPQRVTPEHELVPDPRAGWLTSRLDCGITESAGVWQWVSAGGDGASRTDTCAVKRTLSNCHPHCTCHAAMKRLAHLRAHVHCRCSAAHTVLLLLSTAPHRTALYCTDEEAGGAVEWLPAGANVMLAVQDDLLVEFDMARRAPIGVVAFLEGASSHLPEQLLPGVGVPVVLLVTCCAHDAAR